ncbi:hypothetical protein GDO81_029475 [Engystomops pustulosus]|uniref:Movement protein n=1 Tax=Engystomops pustulosus TaxID=76066 RepID=A0AAV6ZBT5_ENGPU|nr:hypothetical protein GDO81_029475 [Engystomops pustulosus]
MSETGPPLEAPFILLVISSLCLLTAPYIWLVLYLRLIIQSIYTGTSLEHITRGEPSLKKNQPGRGLW